MPASPTAGRGSAMNGDSTCETSCMSVRIDSDGGDCGCERDCGRSFKIGALVLSPTSGRAAAVEDFANGGVESKGGDASRGSCSQDKTPVPDALGMRSSFRVVFVVEVRAELGAGRVDIEACGVSTPVFACNVPMRGWNG